MMQNNNGYFVDIYRPEDFFKIVRRAYEIQTLAELPDPQKVANAFLTGPAYTVYVHKDILLCAGVMILWKGLGEAWVVGSPLMHKYPIFSTKVVAYYLNDIIVKNDLKRVQAVVQKDNDMAHRWIKVLGFNPEGDMPNYRAGKTFVRYGKVIGG